MLEVREQDWEMMRFINQHVDSYIQLDLLHFYGKHPNAKFTPGALACALKDIRVRDLQHALAALQRGGLLEKHGKNGVTFYGLTTEPLKREFILKLSASNWHERRGWIQLKNSNLS